MSKDASRELFPIFPTNPSMSKDQVAALMRGLCGVFDFVHLVDVTSCEQYALDEAGELTPDSNSCYELWGRNRRCSNCISTRVISQKARKSKLETQGDELYHIVAAYVEMEGKPYSLEAALRVEHQTLLGAYSDSKFASIIAQCSEQLYVDPVVNIYNRRYYEDNLRGLTNVAAVAMVDVDNFKQINDRFGHHAGDIALRRVANALKNSIRSADVVARYGGDEFVLVFPGIPSENFNSCLERIREKVNSIRLKEFPLMRITVSIGGVYCEDGSMEVHQMMMKADKLMYQGKDLSNGIVSSMMLQDSME